jgi:hypothetical protein
MSEHPHPNQLHPDYVVKGYMDLSRRNQTPQNLAGKGSVVTAQVRSKSDERQRELFQQQQQQQLQQQQQQQQQLQQQQELLLQKQQELLLQKQQAIERRVGHALNPVFLPKYFSPTTQEDPRALAASDLSTFMERSARAQTPEVLSQRGATTKQQPQQPRGGGRYTKKKSKKSKRKSKKNKMQKKKNRRSRGLVK